MKFPALHLWSAASLSSLFLPSFLVYDAIYNFPPYGFFVTPFAVFVFIFSQYSVQHRLVPEALVIPWALSVGDCFFFSLMKCSQMLPQLNFVAYLLSWTVRCCLAIFSEPSNCALPKGDTLNCSPTLEILLGGMHTCHNVCVEVGELFVAVDSFLPPCNFQGSDRHQNGSQCLYYCPISLALTKNFFSSVKFSVLLNCVNGLRECFCVVNGF